MITGFLYKDKKIHTLGLKEIKALPSLARSKARLWINVYKPNAEELEVLKDKFYVHPTTIEDVQHPRTRAKYEEFDENTFIVYKGVKEIKGINVRFYTLYFIDGNNFLISIYNTAKNDTIEQLMKNEKRVLNLLTKGEDYVLHYIIDKEVDKYVDLKDTLSDDIKLLEEEFMKRPSKDLLKMLFLKEKVINEIKQRVESLTDVCLMLKKPTENFIQNSLIPYFRDVYDHIVRVNNGLRSYVDRINVIRESYISLTSIKINEAMRFLTIIMALMMPMTLITGYYGMNVKLPLQNYAHADIVIFVIMVLTMVMMLYLFKKFGWFGNGGSSGDNYP